MTKALSKKVIDQLEKRWRQARKIYARDLENLGPEHPATHQSRGADNEAWNSMIAMSIILLDKRN